MSNDSRQIEATLRHKVAIASVILQVKFLAIDQRM